MQKGIPIGFIELDPAVAKKAIEGCSDILADENNKAEAIYRQHKYCPNGCGPTMEKSFGGTAFAFSDEGWHIPRCLMKCYSCSCTRNPFDGMIVEVGDPNKARYGNTPIINPTSK